MKKKFVIALSFLTLVSCIALTDSASASGECAINAQGPVVELCVASTISGGSSGGGGSGWGMQMMSMPIVYP